MKRLLKNVKKLSSTGELESCELLIEGTSITKIASRITERADQIIDGKGNLLAPGFIDVHIHLREPGGEHKETIFTGTNAAAKGGYTTVCAMPNTNPVPDNTTTIQNILESIKAEAVVRVLPYAAITKKLQGKELVDIKEIAQTDIFAFTDDGVGVQTADHMLQAMREAKACNKVIVAHCEDNSIVYGGVMHDGEVSKRMQMPGIPALSESVQIARDVLLAEATGCHYHVCHVSTKESVRIIRDAKRAGIHVTAEVTPHHLLLNESAITTDDANFKMNPPLRAKEDQQALLEGLLDGTIDFIATDHAPHAKEEKERGFLEAPFGIVGLENAFSLLYTYLVQTGKITLKQLIDWLTIKPAEIFQLPYGKLDVGSVADLTLIDLKKSLTIDKETFYSKGKNTPFHQWEVTAIPVLTISEGNIVYEEDLK
ncbi:MAG: dihydroorotase [Bacillota bacterium]|uniref:dihydroorotase n=1 Tax=unclassified Virgibacillus TaxID=2620237 RepID=UPI000EF4F48C|nr:MULTISPECIES: dihydroorotase [unclassified Virgibacillus]MCC2252520.1 dihydroorotase [Virgibacillus sp. AGTR]MDY7045614.1 dihydroorotase [Virgibacillus sp. M23]QRZ16896.1 dihydroorotase [Virgibacillus sp. AGTR]